MWLIGKHPSLHVITRVKALFMPFLICSLLFGLSSYSEYGDAQAFRKVVLKHRDAEEVRQIIAPLLPKGSSISVDNNSVLVNTPSNMIKSIVSAIRSVDKPQKILLVSVFRGKYPYKKGVITHTTDTQINQLQTVSTEEGRTIVVSERNVVKLKVRDTSYVNNESAPVVAVPAPVPENSATQIVADDGDLTILTEEIVEEEGIELGTLLLNGSDEKTIGIAGRSQESELIDVPTGIHLRVTLAGKDKNGKPRARVAVKTVSLVDSGTSSASGGNKSDISTHQLSTSIETLATIVLNEWVLISEKNTLSHRPALGANRQVFSTRTSADKQQSVWVKVELQ
jgi:hypothetical protein